MKEDSVLFIGLDMSKLEISVTLADGARNGEVRFLGDVFGAGVDGRMGFGVKTGKEEA